MGVKGLTTFLDGQKQCHRVVDLYHLKKKLPKAMVVIDASSLLYSLLAPSVLGAGIRSQSLSKQISTFFLSFLKKGFDIGVFVDGMSNESKAGKRKKRMLQKAKRSDDHIARFLRNRGEDFTNLSKPVLKTSLCNDILIQTIRDLQTTYTSRLTWIPCIEEADNYIAHYASTKDSCLGIISSDSDFQVFPGVTYFPLSSIVFEKERIIAKEYVSSKTAKKLKLSPTRLILFALHLGTDLTDTCLINRSIPETLEILQNLSDDPTSIEAHFKTYWPVEGHYLPGKLFYEDFSDKDTMSLFSLWKRNRKISKDYVLPTTMNEAFHFFMEQLEVGTLCIRHIAFLFQLNPVFHPRLISIDSKKMCSMAMDVQYMRVFIYGLFSSFLPSHSHITLSCVTGHRMTKCEDNTGCPRLCRKDVIALARSIDSTRRLDVGDRPLCDPISFEELLPEIRGKKDHLLELLLAFCTIPAPLRSVSLVSTWYTISKDSPSSAWFLLCMIAVHSQETLSEKEFNVFLHFFASPLTPPPDTLVNLSPKQRARPQLLFARLETVLYHLNWFASLLAIPTQHMFPFMDSLSFYHFFSLSDKQLAVHTPLSTALKHQLLALNVFPTILPLQEKVSQEDLPQEEVKKQHQDPLPMEEEQMDDVLLGVKQITIKEEEEEGAEEEDDMLAVRRVKQMEVEEKVAPSVPVVPVVPVETIKEKKERKAKERAEAVAERKAKKKAEVAERRAAAAVEKREEKAEAAAEAEKAAVAEKAAARRAPKGKEEGVLPILSHKEEIIEQMRAHRVIAIQGETGCGKSSQVPQFAAQEAMRRGNKDKGYKKKNYKKMTKKQEKSREEAAPRAPFVVVTQPRRIAAISLAKRVASERGATLGKGVGYKIGNETMSNDKTKILFVTSGWLLEKLIHNPAFFTKCTHLILDEVHERSIDSDLLNLLIRQLLKTPNSDTKLIIMSATFDVTMFMNYFQEALEEGESIPKLFVGVKRYPVEVVHLDDITKHPLFKGRLNLYKTQMNSAAGRLLLPKARPAVSEQMASFMVPLISRLSTIHRNDPSGNAILIFLPGIAEIEDMEQLLQSYRLLMESDDEEEDDFGFSAQYFEKEKEEPEGYYPLEKKEAEEEEEEEEEEDEEEEEKPGIEIHILHSLIDQDEQLKVFSPIPKGVTRVVLSTNIAESSVTLPMIRYVIDFGLARELGYDPITGYTSLLTTWVSQASSIQRSGRCGRLFPGTAFRMYPKSFFEGMKPYELPEILRLSLTTTILRLKKISEQVEEGSTFKNPRESLMNALQPPEDANIDRAVVDLLENSVLSVSEEFSNGNYGSVTTQSLIDGLKPGQSKKKREAALDPLHVCSVTNLGKFLSALPFDLRVGRLVALGAKCGKYILHTLIIAVGLSSQEVHILPYIRQLNSKDVNQTVELIKTSQNSRERYLSSLSDAIASIPLYVDIQTRHPSTRSLHKGRMSKFANAVAAIARRLEPFVPSHFHWLSVLRRDASISPQKLRSLLSLNGKDLNVLRILLAVAFKHDGMGIATFKRTPLDLYVGYENLSEDDDEDELAKALEERSLIISSTAPREYMEPEAFQELLPFVRTMAEVESSFNQLQLTFPVDDSFITPYYKLHPRGTRIFYVMMKKKASLLIELKEKKAVTLNKLRSCSSVSWSLPPTSSKGKCSISSNSLLQFMMHKEATMATAAFVPGSIFRTSNSEVVERVTLIPNNGLLPIIALLVYQGVPTNENGQITGASFGVALPQTKKGKKGKKGKKNSHQIVFGTPFSMDLFNSSQVQNFKKSINELLLDDFQFSGRFSHADMPMQLQLLQKSIEFDSNDGKGVVDEDYEHPTARKVKVFSNAKTDTSARKGIKIKVTEYAGPAKGDLWTKGAQKDMNTKKYVWKDPKYARNDSEYVKKDPEQIKKNPTRSSTSRKHFKKEWKKDKIKEDVKKRALKRKKKELLKIKKEQNDKKDQSSL